MQYPLAILGGLLICAGGLFIGGRARMLETPFFPTSLLLTSAAVVLVVSRPWVARDGRPRTLFRLTMAWLATLGCVIFVLVVDGFGGFFYWCSRSTNCMP
jgi:hypothetical protein